MRVRAQLQDPGERPNRDQRSDPGTVTDEGMSLVSYGRAMRHVTDPEAPVYGIVGLPEEVVAVLLAYVSRSPKSFREHLADLLQEGLVEEGPQGSGGGTGGPVGAFGFAQEKARAFHERWVVSYGHSSVAEHAVAHLGVEGISRLASAALELSNPYLSFTEFSQRYQAPVRKAFVSPPELQALEPEWGERYAALMDGLFDAYVALREAVAEHAIATGRIAVREGESPERARRRARRLAFEDARYALPLAVKSSLGMTANGRALRDAVATLRMDPLREVRDLADALCVQGEALLPTLLRHAEAPVPRTPGTFSPQVTADAIKAALGTDASRALGNGRPALLDATGWLAEEGPAQGAGAGTSGENAGEPCGRAALGRLAQEMRLTGFSGADDPVRTLRAWRAQAGLFAEGPECLHAVHYRFAITLSEAAWHQLLRHVRGMHFAAAPPTVEGPITVPPAIVEAGAEGLLARAVEQAATFGRAVAAAGPAGASVLPYVVLNAHGRTVVADLDLWELDHLVRLRLRESAQWDVRRAVRSLAEQAIAVHPFLLELWGEDVRTPLSDEGT